MCTSNSIPVKLFYIIIVKEIRKLKSQDSRTSECLRFTGPNRSSLVRQKNLKREIRWNHFDHNKQFRHLIFLPGLVYKADHTLNQPSDMDFNPYLYLFLLFCQLVWSLIFDSLRKCRALLLIL
jgi:hypothetical protein